MGSVEQRSRCERRCSLQLRRLGAEGQFEIPLLSMN
jgi:hypothetical protein